MEILLQNICKQIIVQSKCLKHNLLLIAHIDKYFWLIFVPLYEYENITMIIPHLQ